jgi:hypothetical protein
LRAARPSTRSRRGDIEKPDVDIQDTTVPGGPSGEVSVRIMRPKGATGQLPVILYTHGAGWVFGNAHTHDRLIREITAGTGAALVFTNYSLSPKARYPIAIEEIYAVLEWIAEHGAEDQLDSSRVAVAGARSWPRRSCSTRSLRCWMKRCSTLKRPLTNYGSWSMASFPRRSRSEDWRQEYEHSPQGCRFR